MVLNKSRKLPRLLYEIQDVNISGAKDKVQGTTRSRSRTAPDMMAPTLPLRCRPADLTGPLRARSGAQRHCHTVAPSHNLRHTARGPGTAGLNSVR